MHWDTQLPKILENLAQKIFYNTNETALHYSALSVHTSVFKNKNAKSCKIVKEE